eukprot:NODE_282_length_1968_cov_118.241793_g235_i0.p1 GENE.NODE_282_length_1968_cov_118.241793_g235_i0~~NODE_282_length_1968_cov_118.241793_g235_i0.p1  ORF type:complete len:470 (-),score=94.42 NODE_282_length_1968_cov_118.241793_g235_i0:154-1563(-)
MSLFGSTMTTLASDRSWHVKRPSPWTKRQRRTLNSYPASVRSGARCTSSRPSTAWSRSRTLSPSWRPRSAAACFRPEPSSARLPEFVCFCFRLPPRSHTPHCRSRRANRKFCPFFCSSLSNVPIAALDITGPCHLARMMGYYSLIGLLRVNTLIGDYHTAIKSIDSIDFTRKVQIFSKVVACHITLYYYTGFVFMMLRRYSDAIKFFTQLLTYINRVKNIHARSYQYDDIAKKHEQVYHLLAMTLALCNQRQGIDEAVFTALRDRLGEKIARLTQGDLECYSEMFKYACPKFVAISTNFNDPNPMAMEALELQRTVFLNEVSQQLVLPTIRSYLSLYSTITVGKLASFMDQQDATKLPGQVFRTYLLRLKHKTRNLVWTGGRPSQGNYSCTSDISFYIDKDMVYIQNSASTCDIVGMTCHKTRRGWGGKCWRDKSVHVPIAGVHDTFSAQDFKARVGNVLIWFQKRLPR